MAEQLRETRQASKGALEWTSFWEGQEMDFELKKKLHEEDGMVRIDVSKETDTQLPFGLITLYTLEWLFVQKSSLTGLSNDLWRLQHLKVLELRNNKIKSLPSSISKMVHLERLNVENNRLEKLPKGLAKLPNLLELDLARNRLEGEFPSEGFAKLEWLDISNNKVTTLPKLTTWKNIKSFWALSNQIKTVPVEFCQSRLDTVNLSSNQITELPDEFGDLPLISLWLSENRFTEFPLCLTRLRRLGTMDLAQNQIKTIPETISTCRYLACLELGNNRLTGLPKNIKKLKHLRRFNISDNAVTQFPWQMLTTVEFERFATSRSDDGLGLKNNPLDAGVLALMERHKKDYAAFVNSVTLNMEFSDSDDDLPAHLINDVICDNPILQISEEITETSTLVDNPTVILLNENSDKFRLALQQFQSMFPNADEDHIKNIMRKHDGNSEQTLDELLSTFLPM